MGNNFCLRTRKQNKNLIRLGDTEDEAKLLILNDVKIILKDEPKIVGNKLLINGKIKYITDIDKLENGYKAMAWYVNQDEF